VKHRATEHHLRRLRGGNTGARRAPTEADATAHLDVLGGDVKTADTFSAFGEADLEDSRAARVTGRRFRDTVLALGGRRHPMEVFTAFRGREPSTAALLRQAGL
jgi:oligopeptidase A